MEDEGESGVCPSVPVRAPTTGLRYGERHPMPGTFRWKISRMSHLVKNCHRTYILLHYNLTVIALKTIHVRLSVVTFIMILGVLL